MLANTTTTALTDPAGTPAGVAKVAVLPFSILLHAVAMRLLCEKSGMGAVQCTFMFSLSVKVEPRMLTKP